MCSIEFGEWPKFYNAYWVKARKAHKCCECYRIIKPKEKYYYAVGKWYSTINTFKTCKYCMQGGKWLIKECGGWSHGGLLEEIIEHAQEYGYPALYKIASGIFHKWSKYG